MGANKNFDRQQPKQPQAGQQNPGGQQQGMGGGRKNDEESGEPIQLNDDKSQQPGQQGKPGMGQQRGNR